MATDRLDAIPVDVDVYIEKYGLGVPFTLAVIGCGSLLVSIPGLMAFNAESVYGKIGLVVLLLVAMAGIGAAGYTYNEVDTDEYMKTIEEDGPGSTAEKSVTTEEDLWDDS